QWSAGVARIQSRVGLNDIVDQTTRLRVHRATKRADHSCGHAGLKSERITNRDHNLSDPQTLRVSQSDMDEIRRVDSNNCEIGIRIVAHKLGGIFPPVWQIDRNRTRIMNHMAVGKNKSVRRDEES